MRFRLTADLTFEAEDIDDALEVVKNHFSESFEEEEEKEIIFLGTINIEPEQESVAGELH